MPQHSANSNCTLQDIIRENIRKQSWNYLELPGNYQKHLWNSLVDRIVQKHTMSRLVEAESPEIILGSLGKHRKIARNNHGTI